MSEAQSVTARAPGKVNIQLGVGSVREDGYHPLASIFHAVELFEEVTVRPNEPGTGITIEVSGQQADEVPTDESNLVWRAAVELSQALAEASGARMRQVPDVHLAIHKSVPVAGGMAGGSADCAAALFALHELWGAALTPADLARIGARLGSDVPFCLHGGTALGLGRGELLSPLMVRGRFTWVFATSVEGLSTAAVYRAFDRMHEGRDVAVPEPDPRILSALIHGDPAALGKALCNDLQEPALSLRPRLRDVLEAGMSAGAFGAIVSGSGPTIAFVAAPDRAQDVAVSVAGDEQVRAAFLTSGPAPGARVVRRG